MAILVTRCERASDACEGWTFCMAEVLCAVQIYLLLLFLRVLLSWFPAFNWERQPWLGLRQVRLSLHGNG